ncbi:MAG: hypothetical protein M1828_002434 [Chrysothrix sp. TS-e1954]|nr:MAG: hypothetical protein M1828_002434 [Chrysothrix sp. TS-e1954]
MSDLSGDEMDVDAPNGSKVDDGDVMGFSSRNTAESKGKRSAANLPVEAEDSLPWVEKYRPDTLSDVAGHTDILSTINKFIDANRLPHLLLYGPPGTGKTSTVLALARRIYGIRNMRQMVLELNASDDRGIDVVREQIKTFCSTKQIFNSFTPSTSTSTSTSASAGRLTGFKLIILDEADAMTSTAQMALRRIIEKYTPNTRFCIIANYTHKLSPALLSRCTRFRFSPLPDHAIRRLVGKIIEEERVNIQEDGVEALVRQAKGDMRRAVNVLQSCHAAGLPSHQPGVTKAPPRDEERELITPAVIHDCTASPHPQDIQTILMTLLSTSDVASCLNTINTLRQQRGLALSDIISALSEELMALEAPGPARVVWCEGLADIESRIAGGGSETVQVGGLVGVVRQGVEVMEKCQRTGR